MDQVEKNLQYATDKLLAAWKAQNCLTCPLAELAALMQATLVFYQEQQQKHPGKGVPA